MKDTSGVPVAKAMVHFTLHAGTTDAGNYSLTEVSGTTNANGEVTVGVTSIFPQVGDSFSVSAATAAGSRTISSTSGSDTLTTGAVAGAIADWNGLSGPMSAPTFSGAATTVYQSVAGGSGDNSDYYMHIHATDLYGNSVDGNGATVTVSFAPGSVNTGKLFVGEGSTGAQITSGTKLVFGNGHDFTYQSAASGYGTGDTITVTYPGRYTTVITM